jgi:hypothetical protein
MSYQGIGGVGLASATNTNTDTSARIHTTARLCLSIYNSLADPMLVRNNKAEFRAIKEEIALGISRPYNQLGLAYNEQRGLPPVFTNTAVMNSGKPDDLMKWYIKFYDCRSERERIEHCKKPCTVKGLAYYPSELYFAGIVMSDAEADPIHHDNALTLMIGGKITIKNGRYSIEAGEEVMWYFEEEAEAGMFDDNGLRVKRISNVGDNGDVEYVNPTSASMMKIRDHEYAERALMKRPVFIKPYRIGVDSIGATAYDEKRKIGVACYSAGSYERVDIKIGRSLL